MCLSTKSGIWLKSPSSSTGCTFPPKVGIEAEGGLNSQRGLASPHPLLRAWSFIFFIYRIIHKYSLSSFCALGTILSSGLTV